jgi:hypothetical protein
MHPYLKILAPVILFLFGFTGGCRSAYYSVMETFGKEKRHLLRDEVKKVQTQQQEASKQFTDTLTRIKEMYGFEGGKLEKFYEKLHADYKECAERAETVRQRIDNVQQISKDLFKEWGKEIEVMTDAGLRSKSKQALQDSKQRYRRLELAMSQAESSMEPVLRNLHDYVLYVKHNLNAKAIGALRHEVTNIELEVATLVQDMDRSIQEAQTFLRNF